MATRKIKKSRSKAPNDENSFNYTLDDDYGKDSFDKMIEEVKKPLRERNILKKNIRVSYNRDSSLENPTTDEDEDMVDFNVVASTPRFKSAPKSYSRGKKSSTNDLLKVPTPSQPGTGLMSKIVRASTMFFNYVSTPTANRNPDQRLNLSEIVSSEGEPSLWKSVHFPNISNYLRKRQTHGSPVPGEEGRKKLKTPDKEKKKKRKLSTKRVSKKEGSKEVKEPEVETQAKERQSEKPHVAFQLFPDTEEEGDPPVAIDTRKTENFILKPGKWRKSIANMRRTIHNNDQQAAPPVSRPASITTRKSKQSVMFAVPEKENENEGAEDEGGVHGRWTKGPRISQYHPGRRRKSIFIASRPDSIIVIDEVDESGLNASNAELLAHLSDDDRDRGLRKPKSSGFFGNLLTVNHDDVLGRNNSGTTKGRSIPVPRKSSANYVGQQHLDVDLVNRLAEQLCLSHSGAEERGKKERRSDHVLNGSSVQLLLHDENDTEGSSNSSCSSHCGSVSSGGEEDSLLNHFNVPQVIVPVDDLVVGSKFARQLSKSHSVVVEEQSFNDSSVVFEGRKKKKKKQSSAGDQKEVRIAEVESSSDEESVVLLPPESPTRFCFIDGTSQVSVRDTVLRYCDQTEPLLFADVYSESVLSQCRKVGEGVYSEVFMYRQVANDTSGEGKAIVLKVIPIEGSLIVNGEVQKKFDEILSEIIISKELSDLRYDTRNQTNGFVNVERVRCVRGRYPSYLVDLWDLYNDNHQSDNDHPEVFGEDQLFIVLELENAGQDLEAFNFNNAVQGHAAFLQTVLTLAVAESKYEFEHRDLHWGNILLRHTEEREATFVLNGQTYTVPTEGVQVTIIDYTLSRMLYKRNYLQFNDLAHDEDLFSATGDYQYEIYRLMRKRLGNVWSSFEPYTNVLWLHYMIDKLINGARYRLKQSKKHKAAIKQLMTLRDEVCDYKSAAELAKGVKG